MCRIGNLEHYKHTVTIQNLGIIQIYKINGVSNVNIEDVEDKNLEKDLVQVFRKYNFDNITYGPYPFTKALEYIDTLSEELKKKNYE